MEKDANGLDGSRGQRWYGHDHLVRFEVGFPAVGVHAEVGPLVATGLDVWCAYPEAGGGVAGNLQTRCPEQGYFHGYSVLLWHVRGAAAALGARVRLSPGELLDFIAGWFGLDLAADD